MPVQLFTVLTEFKFEAGGAIAESGRLQDAVGGISDAAARAQQSIQSMGIGLIGSFISGPGGGILGVLGTALFSFDKFIQKQIQIANILNGNGRDFKTNMMIADEILEDINKKALQFGLPTEDLINVTKLIAPQLMNKGLEGENLAGATDLGRSFLKASPILGIDPNEAFGQLQRAIEGQASGGDTMFNRLAGETQAMKQFVGNAKAFNTLDPAKRVATLNKAFGQFANNTAAVDARLLSLTGQMQVLKNQLTGAFSILRPVGAALSQALLPALRDFNKFVKDNLTQVLKHLGRVVQNLVPDLKTFVITLAALKDLKSSFLDMGSILKATGMFLALRFVMGLLGLQLPGLVAIFSTLGSIVGFIASAVSGLVGMLGGWWAVLNGLTVAASTILAPLVLLTIIFQIISRAIAIAHLEDLKVFAELLPKISEITARFAAMWDVFSQGMNSIASLIAPIFQLSIYIEALVTFMDYLSIFIGTAIAGFQGLVFAIMEFLNQISSFIGGGKFDTGAIGTSGQAGIDEMIDKIFGKIDNNEGALSSNVTNIGKVEINQDFKQQQEPDRIAFTVADTLQKLARNPTQAVNGGFSTSGAGRQ